MQSMSLTYGALTVYAMCCRVPSRAGLTSPERKSDLRGRGLESERPEVRDRERVEGT